MRATQVRRAGRPEPFARALRVGVLASACLAAPGAVLAQPPEPVEARVERLAGMQGEAAGAFYERVRRALGTNDKAAACALVAFPLAHPAGAVPDAAACEARYDDIFTIAVRRAVGRQQWKDVFASEAGVAFGSGELWFAPRCAQRPCGAADLRITAINGAGGLQPPKGRELIACRLPEQAVSVVADGAGGAALRVWASDTRAGRPVVELLRGTPTAEATGQCAWRAWSFTGVPASYTVAEVACMPTVVPAPFGTVARVTRTTPGAPPDNAWCYE